jgi:hypothetical protein
VEISQLTEFHSAGYSSAFGSCAIDLKKSFSAAKTAAAGKSLVEGGAGLRDMAVKGAVWVLGDALRLDSLPAFPNEKGAYHI